MPKSPKVSFSKDSINLDGFNDTENQKDVLNQLAASIAMQVESPKDPNKTSKLEYKRKVEKDKEKK